MPHDAPRVTRFNAPISQNSRHDMSERYDPRVVPHVVYTDQFSHLRQGPPPPRSLNQRVLESARTQAYALAGPKPPGYSTDESYELVDNPHNQYIKHPFIADNMRGMNTTSTDRPCGHGHYDVPVGVSGMPCIHAEPRVGNGNREPCFYGDTATTYDTTRHPTPPMST